MPPSRAPDRLDRGRAPREDPREDADTGPLHVVRAAPPRRAARRRTPLLLCAVLALALAAAAVVWRTGPPGWGADPEVWVDGSEHGDWLAVFNGEGSTTFDDGALRLSPRPAARPQETHAGLVVSMAHYDDVDWTVTMHTLEQTRVGAPNPWEVGWVLWAYSDHDRAYYFTLKPNGWELGKLDPRFEGGQRFLATGGAPAEEGVPHRVRVRQLAATVDVWVDGRHVVTYTDAEDPYLSGAVGMYSEDAVVEFTGMRAQPARR
ncbi:calcium-binding protein [Kineococcus terrestris]|uniref:calcium-binding protein n=1 Tax=Kineococcus terrestris TaxID=2044856 RepID=UPI0034DB3180